MNLGIAELVVLLLAMLAVAIAVWLVSSVQSHARRIAHLEHRLDMLERRGPA